MSKILDFFNLNQKIHWRTEILAGLAVAMTMIPESLSFAILAGFAPLSGLYAAFITGLVAALFGGRPGLISGGAGATVVTLIALIKTQGIEYAFAAVALAGVIQIFVGVFKWAKYIRLVPESVMYGFVNGLAVIIFSAQLEQFFTTDMHGQKTLLQGNTLWTMTALVALTVLITFLFPKITKKFPASLAGIISVFIIVLVFNIQTKTVGDISPISGSLPPFHIPTIPFTLETLQLILPYAVVVAVVGLTEGLLTLNLVDEITETKGNGSRESIAQGFSNILNGFFTGMGGCPMIAQTFVNLNAGARSRISGVIAAITIIFVVLVASPIIERIPMAALVGVMMVVAFFTFNWKSFKIIKKMPIPDVFVMLVVTTITIVSKNLALAVFIGIVISVLSFTWKKATGLKIEYSILPCGSKEYLLKGDLFFASIKDFEQALDISNDPQNVILNFQDSTIADMSALEALNKISKKYRALGKKFIINNLDKHSKNMLEKAGNLCVIQHM